MEYIVYHPGQNNGYLAGAWKVFRGWVKGHELTAALIERDVLARYRGSLLGLLWSFINPLVLLVIYTVVFSFILKTQWSAGGDRPGEFAMMLFCGLIPFNFFCEVLSKASNLVVANPNYVKRVSFPLEILPCVAVGSALIHALISFIVLFVGIFALFGEFHWTVLLLPVVWFPFVVCTLGLAILLSGIGVFVRDLGHTVALFLSALFFLTPIFYPASIVPEKLHFMLFLNPVAYAATNVRKVCVWGLETNWVTWSIFTIVSFVFLLIVAGWFQIIRKRFADVL